MRGKGVEYTAELARTLFEKAKGLMFSGRKNILFVFEREGFYGIHSFFVFFPFDAVYLDEKKKVVEVVRGIMPFTPFVRNAKPAKYLLEMCGKNDFKVGDKLEW